MTEPWDWYVHWHLNVPWYINHSSRQIAHNYIMELQRLYESWRRALTYVFKGAWTRRFVQKGWRLRSITLEKEDGQELAKVGWKSSLKVDMNRAKSGIVQEAWFFLPSPMRFCALWRPEWCCGFLGVRHGAIAWKCPKSVCVCVYQTYSPMQHLKKIGFRMIGLHLASLSNWPYRKTGFAGGYDLNLRSSLYKFSPVFSKLTSQLENMLV